MYIQDHIIEGNDFELKFCSSLFSCLTVFRKGEEFVKGNFVRQTAFSKNTNANDCLIFLLSTLINLIFLLFVPCDVIYMKDYKNY